MYPNYVIVLSSTFNWYLYRMIRLSVQFYERNIVFRLITIIMSQMLHTNKVVFKIEIIVKIRADN